MWGRSPLSQYLALYAKVMLAWSNNHLYERSIKGIKQKKVFSTKSKEQYYNLKQTEITTYMRGFTP